MKTTGYGGYEVGKPPWMPTEQHKTTVAYAVVTASTVSHADCVCTVRSYCCMCQLLLNATTNVRYRILLASIAAIFICRGYQPSQIHDPACNSGNNKRVRSNTI